MATGTSRSFPEKYAGIGNADAANLPVADLYCPTAGLRVADFDQTD